jgi:hypothetical protein
MGARRNLLFRANNLLFSVILRRLGISNGLRCVICYLMISPVDRDEFASTLGQGLAVGRGPSADRPHDAQAFRTVTLKPPRPVNVPVNVSLIIPLAGQGMAIPRVQNDARPRNRDRHAGDRSVKISLV